MWSDFFHRLVELDSQSRLEKLLRRGRPAQNDAVWPWLMALGLGVIAGATLGYFAIPVAVRGAKAAGDRRFAERLARAQAAHLNGAELEENMGVGA